MLLQYPNDLLFRVPTLLHPSPPVQITRELQFQLVEFSGGRSGPRAIELNQQLKEILRHIGPDGLAQGYQNTDRLYFWGHAQYADGLGIVRNIGVCRHYENKSGRFVPSIDPDYEYAD
jgi:hypothetical protein